MALDIWVGDWNKLGSKLIASFDPEAYYSFLWPLFEEFEKTYGQMIDPYDGAMFEPDNLDPIFELINKAEILVLDQNEKFVVHMGTNLGSYYEPENEEIYHTVVRADFLKFISKWKSAAQMAEQKNKPLIFYGD